MCTDDSRGVIDRGAAARNSRSDALRCQQSGSASGRRRRYHRSRRHDHQACLLDGRRQLRARYLQSRAVRNTRLVAGGDRGVDHWLVDRVDARPGRGILSGARWTIDARDGRADGDSGHSACHCTGRALAGEPRRRHHCDRYSRDSKGHASGAGAGAFDSGRAVCGSGHLRWHGAHRDPVSTYPAELHCTTHRSRDVCVCIGDPGGGYSVVSWRGPAHGYSDLGKTSWPKGACSSHSFPTT